MQKNTPPMLPNSLYHIFNRGINSEILFKEPRNFIFFLQKLFTFLTPVADLYAYCLMNEHFHLCIKTLSEELILSNLDVERKQRNLQQHTASWFISHQFARLYNCYAQSINKSYNRTGGLFEEPYRRIHIDEGDLLWLINHIHTNPKRHGVMDNFSLYPHSSFSTMISTEESIVNRDFILSAFGGKDQFISFHEQHVPEEIFHRISMD